MTQFSPATIGAPATLKHERWSGELAQHREWFETSRDRLPGRFSLKHALLDLRLTRSAAAH